MASVGNNQDIVSLNIMPMLDIFSILILFLLMNFSTDPLNHDLNDHVELPYSGTLISLDDIPTIVVSRKSVLINDKKILKISDLRDNSPIVEQGAITPLYEELKKMRVPDNVEKKPKPLTLEIDKRHKFSVIKKVMKSAQQADFIEFKLMVEKEI